jgi:hypothetical protein
MRAVHWIVALALVSCGNTTVTQNGQTFSLDKDKNIIIEPPQCPFEYSHEIGAQLLPILRTKLGSGAAGYDIDHPGIVFYRTRVELLFRPKLSKDLKGPAGMYMVDAEDLEIDMNVCSHGLEGVSFVSPSAE